MGLPRPGSGRPVATVGAAGIPITRHIKVKGEANPFDPAWEAYFEDRLSVKMTTNLKGRRQFLSLWKAQNGRCPICTSPSPKSQAGTATIWSDGQKADRTQPRTGCSYTRIATGKFIARIEVVKPRRAAGVGVA